MADFQVHKTTALPAAGSRAPHSMYYVAPAGTPDYVELYVTGFDAATVRRMPTWAEITQAINDAVVAAGGADTRVVADIAARDALATQHGLVVLVRDASADPTVDSGGATYFYDEVGGNQWVKIAEYESMDMSLEWGDITGRPTSSPAQIDAAVTASHSHTNKTELDKIGQDANGHLTYDGALPVIAWSTAAW